MRRAGRLAAVGVASVAALTLTRATTPAQPVSCGQTITQDARLEADLLDCSAGLTIGADNVTLDLAGHTIDGTGGPAGIDMPAFTSGVTVRNGTIREYEIGVYALDAEFNELRGLRLLANRVGIRLERGFDNRLLGNRIDGDPAGIGIELLGSSRNWIVVNRVSGGLQGVSMRTSPRSFPGAAGNVLFGNRLAGTSQDGIFLQGPFAGPPGASFPGATDTTLERNRASQNGDDGIDVEAPTTTLTRNVANQNADLGIEAVAGVTDGGGNRARGNGNPLQCVDVSCR
jgi:hypothetical protein